MRNSLIFAAAMIFASPAWAACTCVCENGKPKAQCPSVLEKPPVCPASFCVGSAPAAPAMPKTGDCKLEKVINPQTGRVDMQRVCK